MRAFKHFLLSLALIALGLLAHACAKSAQIDDTNVPPVARAWVEDLPFPEDAAIKPVAIVPATGDTVKVTLDGSRSSDTDGRIVSYHWLSAATEPDGGTARVVPMGEKKDWPADKEKPVVMLEKGLYRFSLWVTDDEGDTSRADVLTVQVGEEEMLTPEELACIDGVIDAVNDDCKQCICTMGPTCQAAVVESACDDTCWNLINCIALNCPDFENMAAAMDYSCVLTSCSMFTGAAMAALAAGGCATACPDDCSASAM